MTPMEEIKAYEKFIAQCTDEVKIEAAKQLIKTIKYIYNIKEERK